MLLTFSQVTLSCCRQLLSCNKESLSINQCCSLFHRLPCRFIDNYFLVTKSHCPLTNVAHFSHVTLSCYRQLLSCNKESLSVNQCCSLFHRLPCRVIDNYFFVTKSHCPSTNIAHFSHVPLSCYRQLLYCNKESLSINQCCSLFHRLPCRVIDNYFFWETSDAKMSKNLCKKPRKQANFISKPVQNLLWTFRTDLLLV